jgi:MFS family permease
MRLGIKHSDFARFTTRFWWAIAIASVLSLAWFTPAFLVLKAHTIGVEATFVPIMLILMHLVYAISAYPFGVLADRIDRRLQLLIGAAVLIVADIL